jgi:N-acetylmuramoyl-L-alanine amidase
MLVAVDAGHGWAEGRGDPGAVGASGLMEADVTLIAALAMADHLLELGHEVVLTRSSRAFVSLQERTAIANAAKARVFVSIHCNAAASPTAHGSETLYYPTSPNGQALAKRLQWALVEAGGRRDRGIKPRSDLHVLRATIMPAALVELAFITNPEEEYLLSSEQWISEVARALAEAV